MNDGNVINLRFPAQCSDFEEFVSCGLRDQFTFAGDELEGIRNICVFIVHLYLKVWFQSTDGIAPLSI